MVKQFDMKHALQGVCFDIQNRLEGGASPETVLKWAQFRLAKIEKEKANIEFYNRKDKPKKERKWKVVKIGSKIE
jgi:hypothetical protein